MVCIPYTIYMVCIPYIYIYYMVCSSMYSIHIYILHTILYIYIYMYIHTPLKKYIYIYTIVHTEYPIIYPFSIAIFHVPSILASRRSSLVGMQRRDEALENVQKALEEQSEAMRRGGAMAPGWQWIIHKGNLYHLHHLHHGDWRNVFSHFIHHGPCAVPLDLDHLIYQREIYVAMDHDL